MERKPLHLATKRTSVQFLLELGIKRCSADDIFDALAGGRQIYQSEIKEERLGIPYKPGVRVDLYTGIGVKKSLVQG